MSKFSIDQIYKSVKGLIPIQDLCDGAEITLEGWIRTNRSNNNIGFISLNDGSCFSCCQIVYENGRLSNYDDISRLLTGCSLRVTGRLVITPGAKQPFELNASEAEVLGQCDASYPLQKKRHSLEFLREIPHLRPRTNTFMAVFKIRSVVSQAIHEFFRQNGFAYIHTPIITGNDAEGAGETFTVTIRDDGCYQEDFFKRHACLTVSGQLHVEPFALAMGKVYTFGPTFRAENSNTPYHACEFWMIEPEIAFADLGDDMRLAEDMIKYIIAYVLEHAPEEMAFFNQFVDKGLLERLNHVLSSDFGHVTYTEAIEILEKHNDQFAFPVHWGSDLQTEHERYLTEVVFKKPVFVTDYPKEIKAFYMKLNPDGKTVAAMDCLVPGIGEIIGGSQREDDYEILKNRIEELGMKPEDYDFYLDLRKYGSARHAGFGLGFERMVMYLTGISNIRDVLPHPRTVGNADF